MKPIFWFGVLSFGMMLSLGAKAEELRLAVTTSFHNSGLSDVLLPAIKQDTGIEVHLLVVGTGQALRLGRAGDVDAILVHSRKAEETFVAEGFATHRREIMYNDFVIVGPETDPAELNKAASAAQSFKKIAGAKTPFVSRGDDSGTHRKEMTVWAKTGLPEAIFKERWYRSVGAGMGAALNAASGMQAYVMSDRASWLNFKNRDGMALLFSGDPALFNQYAYLPVNPQKHPHVKHEAALTVEDWLAGPGGQKLIGEYRIEGEVLFVPNAKR